MTDQNQTNNLPTEGGFRAILDQLEDAELQYVYERSKTKTDAEAYRNVGVSKAVFYGWSREARDRLNDLAQQLKRERLLRVELVIQDAAERAAEAKVAGLLSENEWVVQNVATEILNRTVGAPTQRHELTGDTGLNIQLRWNSVTSDDNDAEPTLEAGEGSDIDGKA